MGATAVVKQALVDSPGQTPAEEQQQDRTTTVKISKTEMLRDSTVKPLLGGSSHRKPLWNF